MKRRIAAALGATAFVASLPLACNVFISIGHCDRDQDCEFGRCDLVGGFCVSPRDRNEASTPDAEPSSDADATVDAGADADAFVPPSACDPTAPFTVISPVRGLEDVDVLSARLTAEEKTLIFSGYNGTCREEACVDLFVAGRASIAAPFAVTGPLHGVNTDVASEYWPTLTADGKLLFFESGRSLTKGPDGGYGNDHSRIWTATRLNSVDQFGEPRIQEIFKVGGVEFEASPYLHPSGRSVYFASTTRPGNKGGLDVFVAQLDALGGASSITNVDSVNTPNNELMPIISLDERALYFARDVGFVRQIMLAYRADPSATFGAPVEVAELNQGYDWPSWLSDDACRLYFVSNRALLQDGAGFGAYRLWVAGREAVR